MSRSTRRKILQLGLALFVSTGCTTRRATLPVLSEQEQAAFLLLQQNRINSFQSARILLQPEGETARPLRMAIAFKAPSSLRIDLLPLQGAFALGVFVAEGVEYRLVDMQEKEFRKGPLSRTALASVFGVEINPWDLAPILVGRIPGRFFQNEGDLILERLSESQIMIRSNNTRDRFEIDAASGEVTRAVLGSASSDELDIRRIRSEALDGQLTITVRAPVYDRMTSFSVMQLRLNQEIPDALFRLVQPSEFRVVNDERKITVGVSE
jgi:hypothetical protein